MIVRRVMAAAACAAAIFVCSVRAQEPTEPFAATLNQLRDAGFADKETLIGQLVSLGHPRTAAVLSAFLEDRLFIRDQDSPLVIAASVDEALTALDLADAVSGQPAGTANRDTLTKIGTNNRLRRVLRTTIARFTLASPDQAVRLNAVRELMRSIDDGAMELLTQRQAVETDESVKRAIETALAFGALDGTDSASRINAIGLLTSRASSDVRNRLAALLDRAEDGTFAEPDAAVRKAATDALSSIDTARAFYSAIETLFFGLSLGSVLVLIAIGLAITFGVMGVINMAHGELMMLGAYTTYVVQLWMPASIGLSILVALPAAFLVAGGTGVLIERTIIRFLYGRPLETLLATFGISLVLQQLVRSIFSANNRAVETPAWMSGTWQITEALALTYNRVYIVLFTVAVFALLQLVLKRSATGLHIRAVAQNRAMARAMGIPSARVDALTFGLGAGIAGLAGVALSQLTNVGPNLGQSYIIDSFMVVVFGGVGNLWGTLIGGLTLGVINKLLEPYAGAVLAKIFVLIALIVFIQNRPRGLFPQTGRAAEGS